MPKHCVVPFCNKAGGFTFTENKNLRARWVHLVRRNGKGDEWKPSVNSIVCKKHFTESDFMDGPNWKGSLTRIRMRLKPGAEPSQLKWTKERREASLKREKRQKECEAKKQLMFTLPSTTVSENELQHDNKQIFQQSHACPQVVDSMEVEEVLLQKSSNPAAGADFLAANLDAMDVEEVLLQTSSGQPVTSADCLAASQPRNEMKSSGVQADITTFPFLSFEALEFDNDLLNYYTGLNPPQNICGCFSVSWTCSELPQLLPKCISGKTDSYESVPANASKAATRCGFPTIGKNVWCFRVYCGKCFHHLGEFLLGGN